MKGLILILISFILLCINIAKAGEDEAKAEKWGGADAVIIEKFAQEKGREPRAFIELEGDLELSAFAFFFGIAGFIAGYYWRKLISEKNRATSTL